MSERKFDGSQLKDMTILRSLTNGEAPGGRVQIQINGVRTSIFAPQIGDPMYSNSRTVAMHEELKAIKGDLRARLRRSVGSHPFDLDNIV